MKLLMFVVEDEHDIQGSYRNVWIDENKIDGFYMADITDDGINSINLFLSGQCINVVKNNEIVEFLTNKFDVK